jgi:hypothetical protein
MYRPHKTGAILYRLTHHMFPHSTLMGLSTLSHSARIADPQKRFRSERQSFDCPLPRSSLCERLRLHRCSECDSESLPSRSQNRSNRFVKWFCTERNQTASASSAKGDRWLTRRGRGGRGGGCLAWRRCAFELNPDTARQAYAAVMDFAGECALFVSSCTAS